jgi:hypothetical protein
LLVLFLWFVCSFIVVWYFWVCGALLLLFLDMLCYASKALGSSKYKLHREMPITSGFFVNDVPSATPPTAEQVDWSVNGYPFKFELKTKSKSFIVSVPDLATKTMWLTEFSKLIEERLATERNLAKSKGTAGGEATTGGDGASAVAQPTAPAKKTIVAPVWKSDKSVDACPCCDKKFTLMRRRHHCRCCGDLACNDCSTKRMIITSAETRDPQRVCDKCVENITETHRKQAEHAAQLARQTMGLPPEQTEAEKAAEAAMRAGAAEKAAAEKNTSVASPPPGPPPSAPAAVLPAGLAAQIASAVAAKKSSMSSTSSQLLPPQSQASPTFTTVSEEESESEEEENQQENRSATTTAGLARPTSIAAASRALPLPPTVSAHSAPLVSVCRALYGYTPQSASDLPLVSGEVVEILTRDESGWWHGRNSSGKRGAFPSNYVQELPEKQQFQVKTPEITNKQTEQTKTNDSSNIATAATTAAVPTSAPAKSPVAAGRMGAPNTVLSPAAASADKTVNGEGSSAGSGGGGCSTPECTCKGFTPNPFKQTVRGRSHTMRGLWGIGLNPVSFGFSLL